MLAKIREKTQGIIATLILFFVAIPFILWGISSYFETRSNVAVAKVNGTEINQQVYRRALEDFRGADPRRGDNRAFRELVVESLINQTLLVDAAADRGYRVSNAHLAQLIRDIPYFQRGGHFDPALYEALLRRQGMDPSEFERRVRVDSLTGQVQQGFGETAFVTDADVDAVVRLLRQRRKVSYAVLTPDVFLPKTTVTEREIGEYYEANQEQFRTTEAVQVQYVTLSAAEVAKDYRPTDDELWEAYSAESARYVTPEKRRASHILLAVPADADDKAVAAVKARMDVIAKAAQGNADFAALAKKHSEDKTTAAKGGDLGELTPGLLPPELEAAVKALKPGEVSAPIRTAYGYHLVKLTALVPEMRKPFEAVRQQLAEQIRARKGEERFLDLGERFRNLVYEHPDSLEAAANDLKLSIKTSDWFTRSGGPGIASNPRVVEAAFDPEVLNRIRNSDAVELTRDQLVALHGVGHRPATVRPLAEVRGSIERLLKEQQARERAQAVSQEWVEKLRGGATLAALAKSFGVIVQQDKTVSREQDGGQDRRLVDAVFAAPRPGERPVFDRADLGVQGYAVFALETVLDGDAAKVEAGVREKVRRQLLTHRGAEYYASYRAGLRRGAEVKIFSDQL